MILLLIVTFASLTICIAPMQNVKKLLREEYRIEHTTIQFEETPCLNGQGGCN